MAKHILIIVGNPDPETFSGKIAETYKSAADTAGFSVERINLSELSFDPILRKGYKEIQPLEPDLVSLQKKWSTADHVVVIYPNWWCTMPALLKGMFDRMFLPGFAFNFDKKTNKVIQRLKGKTARVIVTAGSQSPSMTWLKYGDYTNEIQHGILGFAGIKARVTVFGPTDSAKDSTREKWLGKVTALASKGQ